MSKIQNLQDDYHDNVAVFMRDHKLQFTLFRDYNAEQLKKQNSKLYDFMQRTFSKFLGNVRETFDQILNSDSKRILMWHLIEQKTNYLKQGWNTETDEDKFYNSVAEEIHKAGILNLEDLRFFGESPTQFMMRYNNLNQHITGFYGPNKAYSIIQTKSFWNNIQLKYDKITNDKRQIIQKLVQLKKNAAERQKQRSQWGINEQTQKIQQQKEIQEQKRFQEQEQEKRQLQEQEQEKQRLQEQEQEKEKQRLQQERQRQDLLKQQKEENEIKRRLQLQQQQSNQQPAILQQPPKPQPPQQPRPQPQVQQQPSSSNKNIVLLHFRNCAPVDLKNKEIRDYLFATKQLKHQALSRSAALLKTIAFCSTSNERKKINEFYMLSYMIAKSQLIFGAPRNSFVIFANLLLVKK